MDDDAVDAGRPTPPSPCTPTSPTSSPAESGDGDKVVVAEPLFARRARRGLARRWPTCRRPRPGRRRATSAPFDLVEIPGLRTSSCSADYVTTEDGTGLVHQAPGVRRRRPGGAPGARAAGGQPGAAGRHVRRATCRWSAGCSSRTPTQPLVADLPERGLLFRLAPYEHSYPHCWRCGTALLYYALPSWYIRTTAIKDRAARGERRDQLVPDTIKDGRYGDWLSNNIDWALSRTRYWGTPLPLWECADGHLTCVGSLAELGALAGADLSGLDPHRPFVDEVTFPLPDVRRARRRRVPEVIDAWFDSGSMPFAQYGAPHGGTRRSSRRPTRPSSSARRSTRPAAGSTR